MTVRHTIIVDRLSDWKWDIEGLEIQTANDYLAHREKPPKRPSRIVNLCRRYGYLTGGYYCSLLAEARGDLPMPTVADILDLSRQSLYAFALPELDALLGQTMKRLADPPEADFDLHIFFGHADDRRFHRLAAEVFDVFRYPILKLGVIRAKRWKIKAIRPMGLHQVTADLAPYFEFCLRSYTRVPRRRKAEPKPALYDLAILYNPNEKLPPSNEAALRRFMRTGQELRMDVELITSRDYHRIAEYDALFIRETTALDHHTFRFARKAEAEGIPVIDDARSILRCTNKVYMWELLKGRSLPTPKTFALDRATFNDKELATIEGILGYPMVLKIPDGSFSRGMYKAETRQQVREAAAKLFARSRLILAQEFMYTTFDWRIGILNGEPLYACQYTMPRGHWQIVNHREDGSVIAGGFETFAIENAPAEVVNLATQAASLIGNGLYGVDLKQNERGIFIIEINDNPNIDYGVEDKVLKGELYARIMREFIRRIEASRTA
jgi:glutathione synthase/RimK-type ligase-like ATP-grasp enzyme